MSTPALSLVRAWRDTGGHSDARRLVALHMIDCVGNGLQFSTLALYLNRQTGLSVWQIGLGLAVGGGSGLLSNLLSGRLADVWGGRRLLTGLLVSLGGAFLLLPLVHDLAGFVAALEIRSRSADCVVSQRRLAARRGPTPPASLRIGWPSSWRPQALLRTVPDPITDPERIANLYGRGRDRLGGILHEYAHAA